MVMPIGTVRLLSKLLDEQNDRQLPREGLFKIDG